MKQDTLKVSNTIPYDSTGSESYSLPEIKQLSAKDSVKPVLTPVIKTPYSSITDTTSVCLRNSIADITFYDSTNIITFDKPFAENRILQIFSEKTLIRKKEAKALLIDHLNPGKSIPERNFNEDWVILIILFSALLFTLIRTSSKGILSGFTRFFLFRGISDPSSRDIGGLFNWKSTIQNLISFLLTGLFAYLALSYFDLKFPGINGIIVWLISVAIIILAVTLRHIVCLLTGNISGEKEVFREYLIGVYNSYRYGALFLFIIIILMMYTEFLPERFYIISGIIMMGIMYQIRVLRLIFIFLNRNISIFYLILYLCALEILPVLILVKYFTGLI